MTGDEEVLRGGVANAGAVIRSGSHVLRPSDEHSTSRLRFLSRLHRAGFEGAPVPIGLDVDGRERLRFVPGDVAVPPYPAWAHSDEALRSVAALIRRLHDVSEGIDWSGLTWSVELADPEGGPVICHNDVCLENVVFRDGAAVALLDFDLAAPGRTTFDLASFVRMCVPVDDDVNAARLGWLPADRPRRLRLACDAYGLGRQDRYELLQLLARSIESGGEFVRRRAEAGHPGFAQPWAEMGGQERFERRRAWWNGAQVFFSSALA